MYSPRRTTPPLHLLRAFVATARFGSISQAAESLHLTQSAVSKQIQELERWVGVSLFERVRKRLTLSLAGERYEAAIRPLLVQIEAATLDLITSGDGGGALFISTLPTFGAKWLIPRLPDFQKACPQIALHFVPHAQGYDFLRADLDCSILYGEGHWPGAQADYLMGRDVALIAPPSRKGSPTLRKPADVSKFVLLHHTSVPHAWSRWSLRYDVQGLKTMSGPQFDQYHSLIRAVAVGMGLALVPSCLVEDDLAAGTVIAPLDQRHQEEMGYFLCYPAARQNHPPLVNFKRWVLAQCGGSEVRESAQ